MGIGTTQERMEAGRDLLDQVGPEGWRQAIVAGGPLHMIHDCVLDRVYGSYGRGKRELGITGRTVVELGFCPVADREQLADAWMAEARKERS